MVPGGMAWKTLCELQEWIALGSFRLRNDLYCVEWGIKLYSLTRDIWTSRGGRLACSTVAPRRERDDRCLSLRRSFSFAPLIQIQSNPLSRRFSVFLISRLEPFAKVHAPEAGRHAHVMTTTDVRPQLDFTIDVDFGQGLTETRPPTRQTNIQR